MSVVVSANYRDRSQKNFIVRKASDPLEQYELKERVVIKDFAFVVSADGELGFGCLLVAIGEVDDSEINGESLIPIRFDGRDFRETESTNLVKRGSALVLDETGMYYVPA